MFNIVDQLITYQQHLLEKRTHQESQNLIDGIVDSFEALNISNKFIVIFIKDIQKILNQSKTTRNTYLENIEYL